MQDLAYKVRISTLWLLFVVGFFAYRTLALSESATEVSLLADDEFATYLLVAIGFAFLSLILPSRLDRLTNIIAGSIFGVAQVAMFADGITGYPEATFNLMTGATVVIMASIIWLAYKWPKEAATESMDAETVEDDWTDREPHSISQSQEKVDAPVAPSSSGGKYRLLRDRSRGGGIGCRPRADRGAGWLAFPVKEVMVHAPAL